MLLRRFGRVEYTAALASMQAFNAARGPDTADELWLLEHDPVFTLGRVGRREHLLDPGAIPVVASDRGGQVTYHGPGQVVAYLMLDLRRSGLAVKPLVAMLERTMVSMLAAAGLNATTRAGAPGVYVGDAKIAALGLRVARGCSYHGVALNVDLDLAPFARINPCGYQGLAVTSLAVCGISGGTAEWGNRLGRALAGELGQDLVVMPGEPADAVLPATVQAQV